jgi:hypothetical protein
LAPAPDEPATLVEPPLPREPPAPTEVPPVLGLEPPAAPAPTEPLPFELPAPVRPPLFSQRRLPSSLEGMQPTSPEVATSQQSDRRSGRLFAQDSMTPKGRSVPEMWSIYSPGANEFASCRKGAIKKRLQHASYDYRRRQSMRSSRSMAEVARNPWRCIARVVCSSHLVGL